MIDEEDEAFARTDDPFTSHLAAFEISGSTLARDYTRRIFECIWRNGPMTSKEISIATGIEYVSVSPKMSRMEDAGILKRLGTTKANPRSRRQAIIWELSTDLTTVLRKK